MKQAAELPGKYAVIRPTVEVIPAYMVQALRVNTEEWQRRYIGDAINIAMELFQYLPVVFHPDIEHQADVLEKIAMIDEAIREEEELIKLEKNAKAFFLQNIFPSQEGE